MTFFLTKLFVTTSMIVLISEIAKRSDKFRRHDRGSAPDTFLVIFWMYYEGASEVKIANHMTYTLFFVAPTLPMFFLFPWLIGKFGFYGAVAASLVLTGLCLYVFNLFSEAIGFRIL